MQLIALFRLGFPSAPVLNTLTSLHTITRRSILQKVRGRTSLVLPLLVNTGFQVLFLSPSGVLFTFPSRYYALSVNSKYLALGGGPPCFPQDFSCPAVLWYHLAILAFAYAAVTPFGPAFQRSSAQLSSLVDGPQPQASVDPWFGLFPLRSPLLRASSFLSSPPGT